MPLLRVCADNIWEVGLDEVGIGAIAGPVFVAAVVLPPHFSNPDIKDSKKFNSANKREQVAEMIEKNAFAYAIVCCGVQEIDELNVRKAAFKAMHTCVSRILLKYDKQLNQVHLLVDGPIFEAYPELEHTCVVKGDAKCLSIAAASILAKVYRDRFMRQQHLKYPNYAWNQNVGYPTKQHRLAIKEYGLTPLHRLKIKFKKDLEIRKIYENYKTMDNKK